jgi:DnaK suppressor protein
VNDALVKEMRRRIAERLAELEQEDARGQDAQAVVDLDQQAVGRLSRMDALQMQAMAKAQATRRDGEAARLRAALARIAAGDYGFCEDCGEALAAGRLRLDPAARRCVACASG